MDRLLFVPSADELFLSHGGGGLGAGSAAAAALGARGWPTTVRVLDGRGGREASGEILELIDALPVLACVGEEAGPSLSAWGAAARLSLMVVADGRLRPKLRPRHAHEHDPRIIGWTARWVAALTPAEEAEAHRVAERLAALGAPEIALPLGRLSASSQLSWVPASHLRLLRRFLDGTCDLLVREAGWRGAVVRLRPTPGVPADSWEARLVRSLTQVHGGLALDADDGEGGAGALAQELESWAREEAEGPLLLPSPPSWRCAEPLQEVLGRIVAQAAQLARVLLLGRDAPRSLAAMAG